MWSTLKSQWRNFARDSVFTWSWRVSVAIALVTALTIAWYWQRLPPVVPLLYSLPWGEEQLVSPLGLVFLNLGPILVFGINSLLSLALRDASRLYSRILLVSATIITLLVSITTIQIIRLMI